MPRFTTSVASLAHPDISGLVGLLCRYLTETGDVPILVAIIAVHLSAGSMVMKVALVAF